MLFNYAECHYAECNILFTIMLDVVMLSVVAPYAIGLSILGKLSCPNKNKKNTTNKL